MAVLFGVFFGQTNSTSLLLGTKLKKIYFDIYFRLANFALIFVYSIVGTSAPDFQLQLLLFTTLPALFTLILFYKRVWAPLNNFIDRLFLAANDFLDLCIRISRLVLTAVCYIIAGMAVIYVATFIAIKLFKL